MKAKLAYYLFIAPVSLLPMQVHYFFSFITFFVLFRVFGYRKEVVKGNLKNSFPSLDQKARDQIMVRFYKHLADLFAEGIKGYTISEKNLRHRFAFTNAELVDELYKQGKSVLLVGAHYNNWEFLVLSLDLQFRHQGTGVGQKITNKSFGKMMGAVRGRFGMKVWNSQNVREKIEKYQAQNKLFACILLADQNPLNPDKAFWMNFLNQKSPVIFGPEYLAKKYDLPVLFYSVKKVERGVYRATLTPITYAPGDEADGDITYRHAKLLEAEIMAKPEFWLWSHKRWKYSAKAEGRTIRE